MFFKQHLKRIIVILSACLMGVQAHARGDLVKHHEALFYVDYQNISLSGGGSIDLAGYHLLAPVNDWLYLGFGSYAPVTKGEFGGFMAFGLKAHAQFQLGNNLFVNGGLAFGGGGGGKGIRQSISLSGTGGYYKGYIGLGYQFPKFAVGANIAHMEFIDSQINDTQLNLFFQKRFSSTTNPYRKSGQAIDAQTAQNLKAQTPYSFGSLPWFSFDKLI